MFDGFLKDFLEETRDDFRKHFLWRITIGDVSVYLNLLETAHVLTTINVFANVECKIFYIIGVNMNFTQQDNFDHSS